MAEREHEFKELMKQIENNTCCSELNLGRREINKEEIKRLADALIVNSTLQALTLNCIKDKEDITVLANVLTKNSILRTLDLSANRIDKEGIEVIAKALTQNFSLLTLNLSQGY